MLSSESSFIAPNLNDKYNCSIVPTLSFSAEMYSPFCFSTIIPSSSFIFTFLYLPSDIFSMFLDKFSVNFGVTFSFIFVYAISKTSFASSIAEFCLLSIVSFSFSSCSCSSILANLSSFGIILFLSSSSECSSNLFLFSSSCIFSILYEILLLNSAFSNWYISLNLFSLSSILELISCFCFSISAFFSSLDLFSISICACILSISFLANCNLSFIFICCSLSSFGNSLSFFLFIKSSINVIRLIVPITNAITDTKVFFINIIPIIIDITNKITVPIFFTFNDFLFSFASFSAFSFIIFVISLYFVSIPSFSSSIFSTFSSYDFIKF